MAGRRRNWTQDHELERLSQLRADIDSAWGRYITECLKVAVTALAEDQAEWMRRAEQGEERRVWMLRDCDMWLNKVANADRK